MRVELEVEYYDGGAGTFTVEFDGSDLSAPFAGAYTRASRTVSLTGSGSWRTAVFPLAGARFLNSQNAGADFRMVVEAEPFYVQRVRVRRFGVPEEAGRVLRGVAQDFAQPMAGNWVQWGGGGESVRQSDGMVRLQGEGAGSTRLALQVPGMDGSTHEILARIRVVRPVPAGAWAGGVFAGATAESADGVECQLRATPAGGGELVLRLRTVREEGVAPRNWEANQWYWLRVRHAPNGVSGAPDVLARLWPADGETSEPVEWQVEYDYYPQHAARVGRVGLVSPEGQGRMELECDFVLARDAAAAEAVVRLPALKARRARLSWLPQSGEDWPALSLFGSPYQGYAVEWTPDFEAWSSTAVFTDASGLVQLNPAMAGTPTAGFYRARVVE